MGIIIKPVVTEKMTALGEKLKRFGFIVQKDANKLQIYGVAVTEVNTMNYAGKNKSRFTKTGMVKGRANSYKKAIVTLAEGETIDFYSNI